VFEMRHHPEESHAGEHLARFGDDVVERGVGPGGAGGCQDDQRLAPGGGAGVDDSDVVADLARSNGGGAGRRAHLARDREDDDGLGTFVEPSPNGGLEIAGRGRGRGDAGVAEQLAQ
jgi:hypothetical protein